MTTGIEIDPLLSRKDWAIKQLRINENATLREIRKAFLVRLRDQSFVPSSELRSAFRLLVDNGETALYCQAEFEARLAEEARLKDEVATFADAYWELPPEKRWIRWTKLKNACKGLPALTARLKELEKGLQVQAADLVDSGSKEVELARFLRESFALPRDQRAQARQMFLSQVRLTSKPWIKAASALLRKAPATVELDSLLVQRLLSWNQVARHRVRMRRQLAQRQTAPGRTSNWWIWLVIPAMIAIGQGIFRQQSNSTRPSNPAPRFPTIRTENLLKTYQQREHPSYAPTGPADEEVRKQIEKVLKDSGIGHDLLKPNDRPALPAPKEPSWPTKDESRRRALDMFIKKQRELEKEPTNVDQRKPPKRS